MLIVVRLIIFGKQYVTVKIWYKRVVFNIVFAPSTARLCELFVYILSYIYCNNNDSNRSDNYLVVYYAIINYSIAY